MIEAAHRRHFDQVLAVLRAAADEKATRRTFHFTPTSAPWLNAVEGFFARLTNRRLP